ncbi:hypothetical protein CDD83_2460 [Cordyceps sp. RAO-2017]|nr:hypothetical protein CDD83_2460 [Cordyceps sp. RAO-2017]
MHAARGRGGVLHGPQAAAYKSTDAAPSVAHTLSLSHGLRAGHEPEERRGRSARAAQPHPHRHSLVDDGTAAMCVAWPRPAWTRAGLPTRSKGRFAPRQPPPESKHLARWSRPEDGGRPERHRERKRLFSAPPRRRAAASRPASPTSAGASDSLSLGRSLLAHKSPTRTETTAPIGPIGRQS